MKRFGLLVPTITLASPAFAEDDLTLSASTRVRYETIKNQPRTGFDQSDDLLIIRTIVTGEREGCDRPINRTWVITARPDNPSRCGRIWGAKHTDCALLESLLRSGSPTAIAPFPKSQFLAMNSAKPRVHS